MNHAQSFSLLLFLLDCPITLSVAFVCAIAGSGVIIESKVI